MVKHFVEIGAANFDTCLELAEADWIGTVCEPVKYLREQLVEQYKPYPVDVLHCAISDYDGWLDMAVARDDGSWLTGASHVKSDHHIGYRLSEHPDRDGDYEQTERVACMTLDRLLEDHTKVDFLKIDAEGHEINILMNYSFRVKPSLIKVEHKMVDDKILRRKLETNGYLVWKEKDDIYALLK